MYKDAVKRVQGLVHFCPFVMSTCASLGPRARQFSMVIAAKPAAKWRIFEQTAKAHVVTHLTATLMQFTAVSLSHAVHLISVAR